MRKPLARLLRVTNFVGNKEAVDGEMEGNGEMHAVWVNGHGMNGEEDATFVELEPPPCEEMVGQGEVYVGWVGEHGQHGVEDISIIALVRGHKEVQVVVPSFVEPPLTSEETEDPGEEHVGCVDKNGHHGEEDRTTLTKTPGQKDE